MDWLNLDPYWEEITIIADARERQKRGFASTSGKSSQSHLIGLCGEKCYSILTGQDYDRSLRIKGDDGYDFPEVDVKTSTFVSDPILKHPVNASFWPLNFSLAVLDLPNRRGKILGWATRRQLWRGFRRTFTYDEQCCLREESLSKSFKGFTVLEGGKRW